MRIFSFSLVSLLALSTIANGSAQDEPSSATASDSAIVQTSATATITSAATSSANGFSIVLPFGTIVFTKFPFFITIAHAGTKTSTPTPLAPVTKPLVQMNICDATGSTKFPDSCLQLASETPSASAAMKKHKKRGLFDVIKQSDISEQQESKESGSISDMVQTPMPTSPLENSLSQSSQESAAADSELNDIAWSGIDSAESSLSMSKETGIFDIPKGNFLLTPDSESERPAAAAATAAASVPSSNAEQSGLWPTTLIFIESSITVNLEDSLSKHVVTEAEESAATGRNPWIEKSSSALVPLSELQSAIVSAQLSSIVSAKGFLSASAQDNDFADPIGMQKGLVVTECVSGMMRCAPDNLSFDTCLFGKWGTIRACAKGTSCITLPEHSIACA
ncbi:hypothetical protein J3B02_003401 [Coemansia erecta]|nr:hypothetical protein J3B02_003401 [Coemansia erecta]